MQKIKSCGVFVFRRQPELSFLLLEHADRLDLPKGHVDAGETELQCALRELEEETSITADQIQLEDGFRFTQEYEVCYQRTGGERKRKTLVVFLGWLADDVSIQLTEHQGYRWCAWRPPHELQPQTINPLLAYAEQFFSKR